jgi:RHS repeat-associated protein
MARRFAALFALVFSLALARPALAQDPAPLLDDGVQRQTPTINGWPSCDDPPLRTDADVGGCSTTGEAHVLDASSELGDYNDTGDPVALHNGGVSYRATDMVVPGRCLDFELTRRYSSKYGDRNGPLGYGWSLGFDVWLELQGSSGCGAAATAILWNGNARGDAYTLDPNTCTYSSPAGLFTRLSYSSGTYTLRARHGSVTTFQTVTVGSTTYGRLASMTSRNDNSLTFQYFATGTTTDGRSRLQKVIDSMGRSFLFTWSSGRVIKVTDFALREVNYAYDTSGNLISARTPKVIFAGYEHLAPQGRTERYRYFGGSEADIKHLLTEIVRPNQGQNNANGPAAVVFTYNTSGWRRGWCASQRLGDAAGTVGGTIDYSYVAQNSGASPGNPAVSRLKTTVTDRRGNVTEYSMNEYGHCVRIVEHLDGTNQAVTDIVYDNALGASEGLIQQIIYPRDNERLFSYVQSPHRWQQGNIDTITLVPTPSETGTRTIHYVWDPVFNHLLSTTDERGNVTEFKSDWMEGDDDPLNAATYIVDDVAAELGVSIGDAQALVGAWLLNTDLNGDGQRAVLHGNLVQRIEPQTTLSTLGNIGGQALAEGDSTQIAVTTWTYNQYGQRTSMTDAEENATIYQYFAMNDPDGDGATTSGVLETTTGGYLREVLADAQLPVTVPYGLDANGAPQNQVIAVRQVASDIGRESGISPAPAPTQKKTTFGYTAFGYVKSVMDPRGVRTDYFRNGVGEIYQIVRAASVADVATRFGGVDPNTAENLAGQDYAYSELICHDFNGNVAERRVRNLGNDADAGALSGWLETYYTYDLLDNLVEVSAEATVDGTFSITEFAYDENENLLSVTKPEGNVDAFSYDERDLRLTTTYGAGSSVATTETSAYDLNGNLISFKDGLNQETTFEYDGYDRRTRVVAPTDTETLIEYDASSNVTSVETYGWNQGPSSPGTPAWVMLAGTDFAYDARSRAWRIDRLGANLSDGAIEPGNGKVTTRVDYDRLGRRTFVVEDDAEIYEVRYDGANRPILSDDPLRNKVAVSYDDNDNAVKLVETESYPGGGSRTFETYRVFDSLDRLVSSTDELGQTYRYSYDSRDNLVETTDPNGPVGSTVINGRAVNDPGKVRQFRHDSLDRLTLETHLGGADTTNAFNTDGKVSLPRAYDLNGRLLSRADDSGNVTGYEYDALDRQTAEVLADLTRYDYTYRLDSTLATVTDPNGTVATFGYDVGSRLISVDAVSQPGSYVVGTKKLRFEHDGLGRRTFLLDSVDDTLGGNDWIVTRSYDALGRVLGENQGGRTVSYHWTEESKRDQVAYPSGLSLGVGFDALDRVASISEGGVALATYSYAGPGRVLQRVNGNNTKLRYHNGAWDDTAYFDGARRPTRLDHVDASGALLTGFEHAYDRVGNRLYERRLHDGSKGDNYQYDSLYRLIAFERRVPAADVGMLAQGNAEHYRTWTIDGVQNWRSVVLDGAATNTSVNATNEYTSFGAEVPFHDLNGNVLVVDENASEPVQLRYDFLNRLRSVSSGLDPQVITHDYDAEGRRVRTTATANITDMPATSYFVYDGWEEIEEWSGPAGSGTLLRRYVHGRVIDEPVRLENLSFYPGSGTYWYQQTTLGNVAAITNASGAVVERYTYDAYGAPRFETAANVDKAVAKSDFGNPYLFQGRRYEHAIYPLYDFRTRAMDPRSGRFLQRDSIGTWGDEFALGNAFTLVGDDPLNALDPYGYGELWQRVKNGMKGAGSGAIAGAGTGALTGAIVGAAAGGVGAGPGALAGAGAGAISGALAGFVTGFLMNPESSTASVLIQGGISGGVAGAAGGGAAAARKAAEAARAAEKAARVARAAEEAKKAKEAAEKLARAAERSARAQRAADAANRAKSIRSLEQRLAEHIKKLEDYAANPDAYDNLGRLQECTSLAERMRIIMGRIAKLQREIENFRREIEKLKGGF